MHVTPDEVAYGALIISSGVMFGVKRLESSNLRDPHRSRPWFVLRDHAFAVPAVRPWWSLVGVLAADGSAAVLVYQDTDVNIPLIAMAAFGTLFIVRACLVEYPMTLRREGIVLRRLVRHRLVPWSEARHSHLLVRVLEDPPAPVGRWAQRSRPMPRLGWSFSAIHREPLAAVIRRYISDPAARAAIGTGFEYDRLDQFRRRPTTATPARPATTTAPEGPAGPTDRAATDTAATHTTTAAAPAVAPDPPVTAASSADS